VLDTESPSLTARKKQMRKYKIISLGTIKELYYKEAVDEYKKRLAGICEVSEKEIKACSLSDNPSEGEILKALESEAEKIRVELSPKAYKIALCPEGTEKESKELAESIADIFSQKSEIVFIIGSSYGLDESIKKACDLRLSMSRLTFPHRLAKIMLYETIYRSETIIYGKTYHK
jgi:23S rRNA (pseudouridine1915-N3)-methyltransferase